MKHHLLTTIAAVVLAINAFASPIHTAAERGDLAVVQFELENGDTIQSHFEKSMLEDFSEQILPIKDKAENILIFSSGNKSKYRFN